MRTNRHILQLGAFLGLGLVLLIARTHNDRPSVDVSHLTLGAVHTTTLCGPINPLRLTITNAGSQAIGGLTYRVEAYFKDGTVDLVDRNEPFQTFLDIYVPAGESRSPCVPPPPLTADARRQDLVYKITATSAEPKYWH